ncbi:MAG: hypothetical protein F2793_04450 [Actinobacteria bacterium]|nr:hypothetical protein [Actinomycetota bacterium]
MSSAVWRALEARTRARPADPVVTFVSASGERTELSAKTLANNAAKAANALRDEAMLDPGARIAMRIPWHWQRSVWALAAWLVDATIVTSGPTHDCDLVLAGPVEAAALSAGTPGATGPSEIWVVSLHPFGLPNVSVPDGTLDAATIARIQPDAFSPDPSAPEAPGLAGEGGGSALLERAAALGLALSLSTGERFLVAGEPDDPLAAWLLPTLVPLACDTSIVLSPGDADVEAVARQESARIL